MGTIESAVCLVVHGVLIGRGHTFVAMMHQLAAVAALPAVDVGAFGDILTQY